MNSNNFFYKECMKGRSLLRSFQNFEIKKKVKLFGNCLDLGAKNQSQSYYEFIKINNDTKITYTDFYHNGDEILNFDLNSKFPINDNSFDNILIFNVLEHIYDTNNVLSETHRILSKNGILYGATPFLFRHHEDPNDFWRFTDQAMYQLLQNHGFKNIKVVRQGTGIFNLLNSLISSYFKNRKLISILWKFSFFLQRITNKRNKKNNNKNDLYLGIFFSCQKD